MSPFRAPSILLANKWKKEDQRRHQEKVGTTRTKLDTKCPPRYIHLAIDLKRMQKEEEHQATVDYENRVLLQKLSSIMRNPCRVDNWNDYERKSHRSLNIGFRERQEEDRLRANQQFVQRLSNVKPQYDVSSLEIDYRKHKYMQQLKAESTKEYEINNMGSSRKLREVDGRSKSKMASSSQGNLESDSRSAIEEAVDEEAAEENDQVGDLPSDSHRPPPKRKRKPKPKKTSTQTMAEYDAKLLFKIVKNQSQPTDIYIRTLVRRKYPQRLKTRKKFMEMFDADLIGELNIALPAFSPITEVLFSDIDASAVEQFHSAIADGNSTELICTLLNHESDQLTALRSKYKRKFGSKMEADIEVYYSDLSVVNFLSALLEAMASGSLTTDQLRARENVAELEVDEDPFASDGTISRVLEAHGPAQLALMNRCCGENNSSLTDMLADRNASSEATDAVAFLLETFISSVHLESRVRFLNSNMAADNRSFLTELCALNESPVQDQVHKEYRKLFKIPLMEDIARRCRGETTGIVMAMAENRRGPLGKGGKGKVKIEIVNAPPRRPATDRSFTVDAGNPLYRPSQRHYADAAQHTLTQLRSRQDNSSMTSSRRPKGGDGSKKSGSIAENPHFDPEAEARKCRESLEETEGAAGRIGPLLTAGSNQQRQALRRKYKELFAKNLLTDVLDVAAGGEWQLLLTLLLEPSLESQAANLNNSLTSHFSIALLLSTAENDLSALGQKYKQQAGSELMDDLASTSEFGKLLSERLGGKREKSFAVNEEAVRKDANVLDQMTMPVPLGSDELTKLLKKSSVHVCQTFELLSRKRGQSVKDVIDEMFGSANAAQMQCFIQGLANPSVLFSELLSEALKTHDNDIIISIAVLRSEIDMTKIKTTYKKLYNQSLYEQIDQELGSFEWKDTLLQVIKP